MDQIISHNTPDIHLITVCSGAKGVGKTWFSITLSHCLALMKKRVLLFDANGGLQNVACQLGFEKSIRFENILNGSMTLNNAALPFAKGRFDVITAPGGSRALFSSAVGRFQLLAEDLKLLSKYYDCVVIDAGCDNATVENIFLKQSTNLLLLTTPDSESLIETYSKLENLQKLGIDTAGVIVNQVYSPNEGRRIYQTVLEAAASLVGIKTVDFGSISRDARIKEASSSQSLFLSRYTNCDSAREVKGVAQKICEEWLNVV